MLRRPGRPARRGHSTPPSATTVADFARARGGGRLRRRRAMVSAAGVVRASRRTTMRRRPERAPAPDGVLREGFGDDRRPLILFGAGHVGRALVLALAPLPFAVTWVDPRPDAFPGLRAGQRHARPARRPGGGARRRRAAGTFVLVMTHSHPLDLAHRRARRLRDGRFPYVGLIGSATKRARFEKRLARGRHRRRRGSRRWSARSASRGIDSKAPAVDRRGDGRRAAYRATRRCARRCANRRASASSRAAG